MTNAENRERSAEKGERWSRGKQSRLETCQSQDLGMSQTFPVFVKGFEEFRFLEMRLETRMQLALKN